MFFQIFSRKNSSLETSYQKGSSVVAAGIVASVGIAGGGIAIGGIIAGVAAIVVGVAGLAAVVNLGVTGVAGVGVNEFAEKFVCYVLALFRVTVVVYFDVCMIHATMKVL